MTPTELLDIQISELEGRVDNLNAELATVMKTRSDLAMNIEKLKEKNVGAELIGRRKQQLDDTQLQKDNLMKKLKSLEAQIARKRKEKGV